QAAPDGSISVTNSAPLLFGPFTAPSGSSGMVGHLAVLPDPPRGPDTAPVAIAELDTPVSAAQGSALVIPKGGLRIRIPATGPIPRPPPPPPPPSRSSRAPSAPPAPRQPSSRSCAT